LVAEAVAFLPEEGETEGLGEEGGGHLVAFFVGGDAVDAPDGVLDGDGAGRPRGAVVVFVVDGYEFELHAVVVLEGEDLVAEALEGEIVGDALVFEAGLPPIEGA
jgi:hypothetical protein